MKTYEFIAGVRTIFITDYTNVGSTILRGKDIIAVYRDGVGLSKIKTSFTIPQAKEAVHLTTTGNLLVAGVTEPGEVVRVLYQNSA